MGGGGESNDNVFNKIINNPNHTTASTTVYGIIAYNLRHRTHDVTAAHQGQLLDCNFIS